MADNLPLPQGTGLLKNNYETSIKITKALQAFAFRESSSGSLCRRGFRRDFAVGFKRDDARAAIR